MFTLILYIYLCRVLQHEKGLGGHVLLWNILHLFVHYSQLRNGREISFVCQSIAAKEVDQTCKS